MSSLSQIDFKEGQLTNIAEALAGKERQEVYKQLNEKAGYRITYDPKEINFATSIFAFSVFGIGGLAAAITWRCFHLPVGLVAGSAVVGGGCITGLVISSVLYFKHRKEKLQADTIQTDLDEAMKRWYGLITYQRAIKQARFSTTFTDAVDNFYIEGPPKLK